MTEYFYPKKGGSGGGGSPYFIDPVDTVGDLPASAPEGTLVLVIDEDALYERRGGVWVLFVDPGAIQDSLDSLDTRLDMDEFNLASHVTDLNNPHQVTKAQVGLGNADNTSDANKPVSTATQTALNLKQDLSAKGQPNGYASLDAGGLIPSAQLPPIAITDTFVVNSQAAQTALTAQVGDVAVRTDLNKSYILRLDPPTTFSNWQELLTPTDAVLSVDGQTGAVSLAGTYQPLDGDLTAIAALSTAGFPARTAANTWAQRSLAAGSSKLSITNPAGTAGNPTLDVVEANVQLANLAGVLPIAKGGTSRIDNVELGEKNYIRDPNSDVNWLAVGGGISIASVGASALTPDNLTQSTALSITRASGTDYARYRFTLDQVDYSRMLKIMFDRKYAGSTGDYTVRMFSNTLANYTGTSTELTVSPSTSIGTGTGTSIRTFIAPDSAAPYLELRFYGVAGTTPIYLNNILVGPGVIGQVPAIGPIPYSPVFPSGWGIVTGSTLYARRVGEFLHISGRFTVGTVTAAPASIPLPTGLTVAGVGGFVGKWGRGQGGAGVIKQGVLRTSGGASTFDFQYDDTGNASNPNSIANVNDIISTNNTVNIDGEVVIPIAEWSGSGTLNTLNAQVVNSNNRVKVRGTTTSCPASTYTALIHPTKVFDDLSLYNVSTGVWTAPRTGYYAVDAYYEGNAGTEARTGFLIDAQTAPASGNFARATMSLCRFSGTVYLTAGQTLKHVGYQNSIGSSAAGADSYFCVTGISDYTAGQPVGFGLATATDSGLVSAMGPQRDVTALISISGASGINNFRCVAQAYSDTSGNWRMKFNFVASCTPASTSGINFTISGTVFKNITGYDQAISCSLAGTSPTAAFNAYASPNTGTLVTNFTAATISRIGLSGDVELNAKPSWA